MTEWIVAITALVVLVGGVLIWLNKQSNKWTRFETLYNERHASLEKKVDDIATVMGLSDKKSDLNHDQREKWEDKMEERSRTRSHEMIPECVKLFSEIKGSLGNLNGQIDTLIRLGRNKEP